MGIWINWLKINNPNIIFWENLNILTKEISSFEEYNFENLDNKLACIALPWVKSENNSDTVFSNKKLAE